LPEPSQHTPRSQGRSKWKTAGLIVLGLIVLGLIVTYWIGCLLLVIAAGALAIGLTQRGPQIRPVLFSLAAALLLGSLWSFNHTRPELRAEEAASVAREARRDAVVAAEQAADNRRIEAQIAAEDSASSASTESSHTSRSDFEQACENLVHANTDGEITSARSTVVDGTYAEGVQVDGGAEGYGCVMDPSSEQIILTRPRQ